MDRRYLVLYLGADWWGSDARALAVALRKLGHSLIEVQYEDFFPLNWSSAPLRALRKAIRPALTRDYNKAVLRHTSNRAIDFVLVFKGMLLAPGTLAAFRQSGVPLYCFYPDVSFASHGSNIAQCLPLYDCTFTTKGFHLSDDRITSRTRELQLISHGYDPEVHRPVVVSPAAQEFYGCDVSFVGCWSPKKGSLIAAIIDRCDCTIKLWGPGWDRAEPQVRSKWMGRGAYGDELALVHLASKINLGLLSEAGPDTQAGDEVTVRTWQIPATGGFMLHEETPELTRSFVPGMEVGVFNDAGDVAAQVDYYLKHGEKRMEISSAGHKKCLQEQATYDKAAAMISRYYHNKLSAQAAHPG